MSSPARKKDFRKLPPVDARLVAPETRYQIDDGKLLYVAASDEPHGSRHSKLAALLEAHAAEDRDVAVDMLTRTGARADIAPDASVFPRERDPETGGRKVEELAFEVVSTQKLTDAARKAQKLGRRGVRRVFAIDVGFARVFEWSPDLGTWQILLEQASIEDPALAVPLPVIALARAAKADDAVASALLAKKNPVLIAALEQREEEAFETGIEKGVEKGRTAERAATVLEFLEFRGLSVSQDQRDRILACTDLETLARWLERSKTVASTDDLFR